MLDTLRNESTQARRQLRDNSASIVPVDFESAFDTFNATRSDDRRAVFTAPPFGVLLRRTDNDNGEETWDIENHDLFEVSSFDERPRTTVDEAETGRIAWNAEIDICVAHQATKWLVDCAATILAADGIDDADEVVERVMEGVEVFAHPQQYDLNDSPNDDHREAGIYYWHVLPGCVPNSEASPILEVSDLADELWQSS